MPGQSLYQELYDLEINFEVSTFWDLGFRVRLGDDMNGWKEERQVRTWAEVEPALADMATRHFPIKTANLQGRPTA
ncbi:hypothetical protein [Chelatococcus sp. XZ-Ab1]|uniref:hypothetical protein n=1 Tax=Chelatococcus sp. XZ-Ab1 TaxID=3034027 RepID=UPI0023E3564A|nr:hypothetical protein [Chelatococcus sp. XZ-Ab1]